MRPWQKLNSRRGASILFAILIFMMCILAGTAALTAASANSGRYAHMKADQQRYLSVASAAQLLTEEFTRNSFTANLNVTETRDKDMVTSREVEKGGTATDEGIEFGGELAGLLKEYFSKLCWADAGVKDPAPGLAGGTYDRPADPFRTTLTLKAEGMDDVTAELEVNGYDVTIVLYAGAKDSYRTQIRLTAMKTENVTNMNKKFTEDDKVITTWVSEVTVRWPEENVIVTAQSGGASAGGGSNG